MDIDRLLSVAWHAESDKEVVEMIISNRITHYIGDDSEAAVSISMFSQLADDFLKWHEANKS